MKLITTHSFKGGTGKTNVIANLSYALVNDGFKVGVVDSDASHPSLHIMYGLGDRQPHPTLTEFLLGKCESFDIVHDLSEEYNLKEKLYLIPANLDGEVIRKLINEGFEIGHLFRGLKEVGEQAKLDFMLIDTRPGLDEKTMLFLIMTDVLLILVRNDEADIRGTKTLLNIVDFFRIPIKYLTPNMIDVTNTEKKWKSIKVGDIPHGNKL